jgi:alanyl-tRNA synthetase
MTQRIYYTEPGCRAFDAVVTRALEHDGRPAVLLDRTAFYPTSGGQPFDQGRLGSIAVVEVTEVDGDVVHLTSATIAEGTPVRGDIDWERRFDHMQQHTGQHVLSAALDRLFDNRTISFHMGADLSTIDLARELAPAEVERAVDEANRIVWEDHPVAIRFASEEEARTLPLRKEAVRQGELRLIDIDGFDLSACGGTHVARTGSIGVIAVLGTERFKGGARVTFACGGRALRIMRANRDAVAGCVRELSVLPNELPAAIGRIQAEAKALRKTIGKLQASLAVHEADQLLAETPETGATRVLVKVYDGWDAAGLKAIASALVEKGTVAVALISADTPAFVVVARSSQAAIDANAVLSQLTKRFGGRGGGKPDLAQAGGLNGDANEIADAARELLRDSV